MLYGGLDVETVKMGKSRCKNAAIAEAFHYMHIIESWGTGVPFGQANVQEWLNCSKSKATNVMKAMKTAKIIKKVSGVGFGRYQFIEL